MYSNANTLGKVGAVLVALAMAISAFAMITPVQAQTAKCNFTRDLFVGATGEDVRCLQVYLNTAGNARIASTGAGAPGSETTTYGGLTASAVARWQAANGIGGPNGNFGPASRAKYNALVGGGVVTPAPTPGTTDQIRARIAILEAVAAYQDAEDENGDSDLMEDALTNLLNGMVFYVNASYTQAIAAANNATNDAEDAMGNSDDDDDDNDNDVRKSDAEDIIDEAEAAVSDAEDDVNEAAEDDDADDDDIDEAEDLIAEAEDLIDDAWAAYDDEDYDEAVDLAEEAEDLADEAVDVANGNGSNDDDDDNDEEDAEDAIEEAQDDLASAWDAYDDSDADEDDLDEAEELLDEADELIDEAQDAFDDEDWDEVMDIIDDANEAIDDALELI